MALASMATIGDVAVVRVRGDLDTLVADELRDALAAAGETHRHVLLDLSGAALIDAVGLSLLVRAHQNAKRNEGVLGLIAPSRFVITALTAMRLYPVFPIFPDTDSALLWLRATAADPPSRPGAAGRG